MHTEFENNIWENMPVYLLNNMGKHIYLSGKQQEQNHFMSGFHMSVAVTDA